MVLTPIVVQHSLPVFLYLKVVGKYSLYVCVCGGVGGWSGCSGKYLVQEIFSFACIKFI